MPGRRVGAQNQTVRPGELAADKFRLEAPILLDRAARQQFRLAYPNIPRAACLGQKAGEMRRLKSRQRRGRHRPK